MYRLTAKADRDGVGKLGDPIPDDHPKIAYYKLHEYVEPAPEVEALEEPPMHGAFKRAKK